jgi:hypothetical protein
MSVLPRGHELKPVVVWVVNGDPDDSNVVSIATFQALLITFGEITLRRINATNETRLRAHLESHANDVYLVWGELNPLLIGDGKMLDEYHFYGPFWDWYSFVQGLSSSGVTQSAS